MFDPNICWFRSSMVVWDLFSFKIHLLIQKVNIFLQENQQIQCTMYILYNTLFLSLYLSLDLTHKLGPLKFTCTET